MTWDVRFRRDLESIDDMDRRWRLVQLSTCPNCRLRWQSEDPRRDFARLCTCPECGTVSKPGRGDRVMVERRERGVEQMIEEEIGK